MRLIDADALLQRAVSHGWSTPKWVSDITINDAPTIEAEPKGSFYDGYVYCLMDFGKDTVLCRDCKHYKQSAVTDRKMCFRKDVDGIEVCYDFLPYDSCTYGERKDEAKE